MITRIGGWLKQSTDGASARRALGLLALAALVVTAALDAPAAAQPVRGSYVHTLSSFTGVIPYNWSRLAVDHERSEIYVLYQNTIRVFNPSGMEIYRFGDDLDVGQIVDVAVDDRGDVLLLTYREDRTRIVRCNYRGEPRGDVALTGLPRGFAGFAPNRMAFRRGQLYLAASMALRVVVADRDGAVSKAYDLFRLLDLDEKERDVTELGGFSVDGDGKVLMTIPVLARAFVLGTDGRLVAFGRPGGAPGRFNIPAGIARDGKGNLLVVDKVKAAVQVFDASFTFVTQFAGPGPKPGQLSAPDDLRVDDAGRVYVTQMGKRGISVFRLTYP